MRRAKTKKKARLAWSKDEVKLLKELFPQGRAREIAIEAIVLTSGVGRGVGSKNLVDFLSLGC